MTTKGDTVLGKVIGYILPLATANFKLRVFLEECMRHSYDISERGAEMGEQWPIPAREKQDQKPCSAKLEAVGGIPTKVFTYLPLVLSMRGIGGGGEGPMEEGGCWESRFFRRMDNVGYTLYRVSS
eukprot:scaffold363_cov56-Cylindrotheca_fusiformis.AAC.15